MVRRQVNEKRLRAYLGCCLSVADNCQDPPVSDMSPRRETGCRGITYCYRRGPLSRYTEDALQMLCARPVAPRRARCRGIVSALVTKVRSATGGVWGATRGIAPASALRMKRRCCFGSSGDSAGGKTGAN